MAPLLELLAVVLELVVAELLARRGAARRAGAGARGGAAPVVLEPELLAAPLELVLKLVLLDSPDGMCPENMHMPAAAAMQAFDERADIGILTVISAELEAALKAFPLLTRTKDPQTGTIYRTGTIHSELTHHDYRVVLACIGEPGNPSAAAAVTELVAKYGPRAVLLMGIAGGMRGKTKIGDVVLSERVVAYEPAALTKADDGTAQVEHRPDIDRRVQIQSGRELIVAA